MPTGLRVDIFRSDYRCPLNQFDDVDELTIINIEAPHEADEQAPAAVLEKGPSMGGGINPVIRPVNGGDKWFMFGGNFAHTSDSRLDQAIRDLYRGHTDDVNANKLHFGAVCIHDRHEGS